MRTRLTAGEKPNRKRMAPGLRLRRRATPRRPHDIIAPPGVRHGTRTLRPRTGATAKWLAGSVKHDPADTIAAACNQAEARDACTRRGPGKQNSSSGQVWSMSAIARARRP